MNAQHMKRDSVMTILVSSKLNNVCKLNEEKEYNVRTNISM